MSCIGRGDALLSLGSSCSGLPFSLTSCSSFHTLIPLAWAHALHPPPPFTPSFLPLHTLLPHLPSFRAGGWPALFPRPGGDAANGGAGVVPGALRAGRRGRREWDGSGGWSPHGSGPRLRHLQARAEAERRQAVGSSGSRGRAQSSPACKLVGGKGPLGLLGFRSVGTPSHLTSGFPEHVLRCLARNTAPDCIGCDGCIYCAGWPHASLPPLLFPFHQWARPPHTPGRWTLGTCPPGRSLRARPSGTRQRMGPRRHSSTAQ